MKKKLSLTKLLSSFIFILFFITGCSNLSYSGDDYNPKMTKNIQTSEGFYFSTYLKKSESENIEMRAGISKTPIETVFVVYSEITNYNSGDYTIYQKDFGFYDSNNASLTLLAPSMYINAYQSDQTSAYAGMQAMAPSINNMATIANNFQRMGPNQALEYQTNKNVLGKQIAQGIDGIVENSLKTSLVIPQSGSRYFYIFLQRAENFPITMKYKDLTYTFGTQKEADDVLY